MEVKSISLMLTLDESSQDEILRMLESGYSVTEPDAGEVLGVCIDASAHRAYVDGLELQLTATEFDLLSLLASKNGHAVSYDEALEVVWKDYAHTSRKMVSNCISRLRKKLGAGRIESLRGYGYRLC